MKDTAIKAVIFDCFGVLVQGSLRGYYDRHFGDDEVRRVAAGDLEQLSSRGQISHTQWLEQLAELAGISVDQADREIDDNPPNLQLFDYIETTLKPQYRIGFLSNTSEDWRNDLFTQEQLALFDDFVLSYQFGMAKPDQRIYELAAKRLGVSTEECVFVDDIERYCTGAKDAGMQAVQYHNFAQFQRDLLAVTG